MNVAPPPLRESAEALAAALPPLLARAEALAATVVLGEHGRRRAGMGDEFWQYRAAMPGDPARSIDWRRSARSDSPFVREREWQAAQSVAIWVDPGRAMAFTGAPGRAEKGDRARLVALALAVLLLRGGERVGLAGPEAVAPRAGRGQLMRLGAAMLAPEAQDHGAPDLGTLPQGARAVLVSDFLGAAGHVEAAVTAAADRGITGAILQVLDPVEESFPFGGRTVFESVAGALRFEARQADNLRDRYRARLAERKAALAHIARHTGWQYGCHHTDAAALTPLIWSYHALERGR